MRIPPSSAPAVLVAGALLLSACGGDSPLEGRTGSEVSELAADALEESGAVHVAGTMTEDGEKTDIDVQLQGADVAGSLTVNDVELELLAVDGDVFVQATPSLLAPLGISAESAEQYEGRWVALPSDAGADFEDFSLAGMADELRDVDDVVAETRADELDGDDVVVVGHEDGSELTVADDDPALPLRLTGGDGTEGAVVFSEHGEEADLSAPRDAIDLEELVGG
jgi:hypothetical protein